MADEPERRPESDADAGAAEDDAGRDEPDSEGSGSDRERREDGVDTDAEIVDGDDDLVDRDDSDEPSDGDSDGNLSEGDPETRRDEPGDAGDAHPAAPTPDEAAAAREASGDPTSDGQPTADVDGDSRPAPDEVYGPKRPGHEPKPPVPDDESRDAGEASSDGGAVSVDRPDNMAETTAVERKTGPASDEEMPLADHIEEMVTRLFVVIAIAGVVSVAVFPFGEDVIDFLWYSVLPGGDVAQPRVYHPLSLILTQLKVASLAGLIVALPVFVYETYAFMRPGLYPNERRYYLASVPMSLVLALVGVTFAYFIVLPAIFTYFLYYSETVTTIAFALSDTFNLILLLMGYLALVFQIPLFIMLAIMMGLTTRQWLQDRRLYFWGGFLGIAFLFSPDPTGMAPIMVAATMIVLFEGTLLLLRWTGR